MRIEEKRSSPRTSAASLNRYLRYVYGLLAVCAMLMTVPVATAQTADTGALTGTITDPSGGAVPDAAIKVVNEATGDTHELASQSNGIYLAPLLLPGSYRMEVSKTGFKTAVLNGIAVSVTETGTTNVRLQVGEMTQSVTVNAQPDILQTNSPALGHVTDERTVGNLPLVTRNYTQILGLSPGVSSDVNNAAQLGSGTALFSSHGEVQTDNNFQMNGFVANDLFSGALQVPIPNPDTIQEFKVQTGQYDAAFGRNAGANVNVVTKGGGNQFHGTAFEFFRNEDLNANDYFLNQAGLPRGVLKQNQFGGTIGGPVVKDKLFFFGSYQGTRQRNGLDMTCLGSFFTPTEITSSATSRTAMALGAAFAGQPGVLGPGVLPDGSNISPQAIALLNATLPGGGFLIPAPQNDADGSSSVSTACPFSENPCMTNGD
jgi:hypothetical protein